MADAASPTISAASSDLKLEEMLLTDGDDYGFSAKIERQSAVYPHEPAREDSRSYSNDNVERARDEAHKHATEEDPPVFHRSTSLNQMRRNKSATYEKADRLELHKLHRISVYETTSHFYIIGGDITDSHWRMIKVDRIIDSDTLAVIEDEIVYTKKEMNQLLNALEDGNRSSGGMNLVCLAWGLLGFIKFTSHFYMVLITKRSQVAMVGGHYIYQINGTQTIALSTQTTRTGSNPEEARYLSILQNLDLHRSFYFSYSYDITRTLQHNIGFTGLQHPPQYNSMFVWNQHLIDPALGAFKNPYDWCVPVIHGFIDQSAINIFGSSVYITLIARRSRFFAGARFLKRGANDQGFVANDVETEQIVADMMVTSFDGHSNKLHDLPNYTSFVQHRGSIPLYWTQDNSGVSPKPAIDINLIDPFFATPAQHFDNLFARYGAPVCCLNLVKQVERTPRESKLSQEYERSIKYLNQSLPDGKKLIYEAYDMSRMAKKKGVDVIRDLERVATRLVLATGFFHNGPVQEDTGSNVQNGVIRSNCIDCLDRTNAAQFVIGKRALEFQLQALGIVADATLNYDTDTSNLFAHMFNDHGDTLASQYGGSHLVNTTDSYRKINNWQSHSRDMLESFKRYYHNSFLDSQRQEAYNLFLGNYSFVEGQPMLWDLPNDYYLHHAMPSHWTAARRSYVDWFTPEYLVERRLPATNTDLATSAASWWHEYYRPPILSSFMRLFAYNINSTTRYVPKSATAGFDMSPFTIRKHTAERTTTEAPEESPEITPLSASAPPRVLGKKITSLQKWLNSENTRQPTTADGKHIESTFANPEDTPMAEAPTHAADRSQQNQWTLAQFYAQSLHPSVSSEEQQEYERYVNHPLQIPLVSTQESATDFYKMNDFADYLNSANSADSANMFGNVESDLQRKEYTEWIEGAHQDDPLSVFPEDYDKKRYQAYRKWLRGKSLFKQSKVDPEYRIT